MLTMSVDYAPAEIERFYRKELAGQLGNLLSRVAAPKLFKKLGHEGPLSPAIESVADEARPLVNQLRALTSPSFCPPPTPSVLTWLF